LSVDIVIKHKKGKILKKFFHSVGVISGSVTLTLIFFLVLPLMQSINKPPTDGMVIQNVDTVNTPPPPPPEEEEPEKEPEPEEKPPELMEESQPLDLSQLELALNPGFGGNGWMAGGDFTVKLNTNGAAGDNLDALFSMADLDQKPRVIYQPGPILSATVRKKAPGTVYILFIVNKDGRVEKPIVQRATDPIFEKPALDAIKKWKFEPGKRKGESVRFRMRVPITFPKG